MDYIVAVEVILIFLIFVESKLIFKKLKHVHEKYIFLVNLILLCLNTAQLACFVIQSFRVIESLTEVK